MWIYCCYKINFFTLYKRRIKDYNKSALGGVAHLGERLNGIQEVRGSIPLISTTNIKGFRVSRIGEITKVMQL